MNFWRSSKRRSASHQPSLPGLFSAPADRLVVKRLATPGEHALDVAKSRLIFAALMFFIAYIVVGVRLIGLSVFSDPPDLSSVAVTNEQTSVSSRADVTDRNGTVLATSLPTVSVCANAKKLLELDDAVRKIETVIPDLDSKKLLHELRTTRHCVMVQRHLTPKQSYALNKLGIAGLEFLPDERRLYPAGNLTAHLIGFTDIDNQGLAGAEKYFNARLMQEPEPITLSIDLRLQTILHREIKSAMATFHATGGSGLIMDVNSGEILSMVSLPDFDPHRPGEAPAEARFNQTTLGVYEMGSTFKVFNTAMALDSGLIRPSDQFDTTHPIEIGRFTIRNYHPAKYPLNVTEILMESSNIGSARMAERMGGVRQRTFLTRLGLTEKAQLEFPEIGAPLVPSTSNWGEATTLTVSYGHGIAVNAIQTASAYASLVNDGIKVKPTLLKVTQPLPPPSRLVSQKTSQQLRAMLRLVVAEGTAKQADVPGYLVGGKTGTADKQSGHGYSANSRRASFVGIFPIQAPRFLVLVMLDDPKGTAKTFGFATAGWTAAPVVRQVIAQMGPLLGLAPLDSAASATTEQHLFKTLGGEVLARLREKADKENETNNTYED